MNPLLFSRRMRLDQLPPTISIPPELDEAMQQFTSVGLQQMPLSREVNCVIYYDGSKFSLVNKAIGEPHSSTTVHVGANGVGMYHSHPGGGPIDIPDLNQMFSLDRGTENFSMVDGSGNRRTALFKTMDSPTRFTGSIQRAQTNYSKKHPSTYNHNKDWVDEIVEAARCAYMGYYAGRERILYRVYPDEKTIKAFKGGMVSGSRR